MPAPAVHSIKPPRWNYNAGLISAPYRYWAMRATALFPFFEIGGRVRDYRNALIASTTAPWISTPYGPAQEFTTDAQKATTSYISLLDPPLITVWARIRILTSIASQEIITQKGWTSHVSPFYIWSLMASTTQLRWLVTSTTAQSSLSSTTNYVQNQWLDLIGTWDGITNRLWSKRLDTPNTVLTASAAFSGTLRATSTGITIGGYRNITDPSHYDIAAIGVWPYGFTNSEVYSFLKDPMGIFRPAWYDLPAIITAPAPITGQPTMRRWGGVTFIPKTHRNRRGW